MLNFGGKKNIWLKIYKEQWFWEQRWLRNWSVIHNQEASLHFSGSKIFSSKPCTSFLFRGVFCFCCFVYIVVSFQLAAYLSSFTTYGITGEQQIYKWNLFVFLETVVQFSLWHWPQLAAKETVTMEYLFMYLVGGGIERHHMFYYKLSYRL